MNNNITLMALATGKPVSENNNFPDKKELEKIYGRTFEKEPEYLTVDPKTGVKRLRVDFIIQTIPDKCNGIDMLNRVSIWLWDAPQYKADKSKVKVSNAYGQFTWMTKEELKAGILPEGVLPQFFVMDDVRPAFLGEERIVNFLRAAINIPSVIKDFSSGELIADKSLANVRLDTMKVMVTKGDVTELKKALPLMKTFKLGAGARSTDDNRIYQDWFIDYPMKGGLNDMQYYAAKVKKAQDNGAYPNTNFGESPFTPKVFEVTPTILKSTENDIPVEVGMDEDDWL